MSILLNFGCKTSQACRFLLVLIDGRSGNNLFNGVNNQRFGFTFKINVYFLKLEHLTTKLHFNYCTLYCTVCKFLDVDINKKNFKYLFSLPAWPIATNPIPIMS